jgi:hypothetical protein
MSTKQSDQASGRTNPDSATGMDPAIIAGRTFTGVRPVTVTKGGGKVANPLDPTVVKSLNFQLYHLTNPAGDISECWDVYDGTQAGFRKFKSPSGTNAKWLKDHSLSPDGRLITITYHTVDGFKQEPTGHDNEALKVEWRMSYVRTVDDKDTDESVLVK